MSHIVTCIYCHQKFDRDKEPYKQIEGRRYAHAECATKQNEIMAIKRLQDLEKLENYIKVLFNEEEISEKNKRQIDLYITKKNYTYSGILKTLIYFFDIKKNPISKANGGIGIVPYVYEEAKQFYYNLWLIQQENLQKNLDEFKPQKVEIIIKEPQRIEKKKRLFDYLDEEEEN